jgi:DNA-directed RNA polymerase subunit K/omega
MTDFEDIILDEDFEPIEAPEEFEELGNEEEEEEVIEEEEVGEEEEEEERSETKPTKKQEKRIVSSPLERTASSLIKPDELRPAAIRRTQPILFPYEYSRVVQVRAKQLAQNADTTLTQDELGDTSNVIQIAMKELYYGKMPLVIRRIYPSGIYEDWDVNELRLPRK